MKLIEGLAYVKCPHCDYIYDEEDTQLLLKDVNESPFMEYCVECDMAFDLEIRVVHEYRAIPLTDDIHLEA